MNFVARGGVDIKPLSAGIIFKTICGGGNHTTVKILDNFKNVGVDDKIFFVVVFDRGGMREKLSVDTKNHTEKGYKCKDKAPDKRKR